MGSSGRRGTPRTKRPLLVSARSLDCPAPSSCTQHVAGPAAPLGWGRNILLYKVGSLTTFGIFKITFHFKFMKTWTYSSPYFPFLPSRRKKKIRKPLGRKDLRNCLAVPRRSEPISILGPEPGVWGPPS